MRACISDSLGFNGVVLVSSADNICKVRADVPSGLT